MSILTGCVPSGCIRVLIVALTPIHHFRGKLSSDDPSFFLLETDQQKVFNLFPDMVDFQVTYALLVQFWDNHFRVSSIAVRLDNLSPK